ncbi:microfibril-associated glycoprotein 4-like [Pocillopora damicornis]|uniref:microfibril-associated glycoprotein 4-like n=1 Tax=Pocillopora damicornis TaxID=46731 RepID=UPI000F54D860|nr:microfibril-associated glycoprotein 4-like [Pocillopora damicornis]
MMKYLCEVLLFCFFLTALSNATKLSSKPARTDNDTKHRPHCSINNNYFYAGQNSRKIENMFSDIQQQLTKLEQEIRNMKNQTCEKQDGKAVYKNCAEVYRSGDKISGVYKIDPDGLGEFEVFCDQTTAGGGWTVFQKRYNGAVDFFRAWDDYKRGFGNLNGEFWLGLDKMHRLTASSRNKLRVDLEDIHGNTAFAEYGSFSVASERVKYLLKVFYFYGFVSGFNFD